MDYKLELRESVGMDDSMGDGKSSKKSLYHRAIYAIEFSDRLLAKLDSPQWKHWKHSRDLKNLVKKSRAQAVTLKEQLEKDK